MDAGSPGPAHQPGHAHAGALSLELSHRGRRFLVNSGTSTYEPGAVRAWERSTAAHNTLRLAGRDQSEMWAAFRLARRARVTWRERGASVVCASHDGYAPHIHTRRLQRQAGALLIEDYVSGHGEQWVELFFHLHPEITVDADLLCRHADGPAIRIHPPAPAARQETLWSPEFGLQLPNQTVLVRARVRLPLTWTTRLELLPT